MSNSTGSLEVTVHMVSSPDGYVVDGGGGVAWLETSDHDEDGVEPENPSAALAVIDARVIGSKTYETALRLGRPTATSPRSC